MFRHLLLIILPLFDTYNCSRSENKSGAGLKVRLNVNWGYECESSCVFEEWVQTLDGILSMSQSFACRTVLYFNYGPLFIFLVEKSKNWKSKAI